MLRFIHVFITIALLLSTPCWAERETHGGDEIEWDALSTARKIIEKRRNHQFVFTRNDLDWRKLKTALERAEFKAISIKDPKFFEKGFNKVDPETAVTNSVTGEVWLHIERFQGIKSERKKWAIIIHELCHLMEGIDDSRYEYTDTLIDALMPQASDDVKRLEQTVPLCGARSQIYGYDLDLILAPRGEAADLKSTLFDAYLKFSGRGGRATGYSVKLAEGMTCRWDDDYPGAFACRDHWEGNWHHAIGKFHQVRFVTDRSGGNFESPQYRFQPSGTIEVTSPIVSRMFQENGVVILPSIDGLPYGVQPSDDQASWIDIYHGYDEELPFNGMKLPIFQSDYSWYFFEHVYKHKGIEAFNSTFKLQAICQFVYPNTDWFKSLLPEPVPSAP